MPTDIFIKFDDVKGESADAQFKDHCELHSWSWGVAQMAMTAGGGMGAGKAQFQDFSVSKNFDSASSRLMQKCATGQHFKKVELSARKAGGEQQVFLKYTFKDAFITSYNVGAGGDYPTENVSFAYGEVKIEYFKQDAKGGVAKDGEFAYSVKTNKAV